MKYQKNFEFLASLRLKNPKLDLNVRGIIFNAKAQSTRLRRAGAKEIKMIDNEISKKLCVLSVSAFHRTPKSGLNIRGIIFNAKAQNI